jgi:uncharacterized HAD superfamily protein
MKVFIDIDGIITNETEGHDYELRTPNEVNIQYVNIIFRKHEVTLYSARYLEDLEVTKKWLEKYNVHYDHLILGKPQYDILIDDKAFHNMEDGITHILSII